MKKTRVRVLAGICFLFAGFVMAQEKFVSPDGNDQSDGSQQTPWRTLVHGVTQMNTGTLWLEPGVHTLEGEVVVGDSLTIRSVSGVAEDTLVVGNGSERCFMLIAPEVVLRGLSVTNGNAGLTDGGNIHIAGAGTAVLECRVLGGKAVSGGGIYVADTALGSVISNTVVASNQALARGGGVFLAAGMVVDSLVEDNQSAKGGGVYSLDGFIKGCRIVGNKGQNISEITAVVLGDDEYIIHHFTEVGRQLFIPPEGVEEVEYLVVAGGGGGGCKESTAGGGGGAGGMLTGTVAVTPLMSYGIMVGAGGTGSVAGVACMGGNGGNSRFHMVEAIGGGGGQGLGDTLADSGQAGGSGGGGARWNESYSYPGGSGIAGQGYDGGSGQGSTRDLQSGELIAGRGAGGGGGAGGPGESTDGTIEKVGHGGPGLYSDITGMSVAYAGGGGSGHQYAVGQGGIGGGGNGGYRQSVSGEDGQPNSGGGGGGMRASGVGNSGAGGSGIVIVRYVKPEQMSLAQVLEFNLDSASSGGSGAGIYLDGRSQLIESIVSGNRGATHGGGVYLDGGDMAAGVEVVSCLVEENQASARGGGVFVRGNGTQQNVLTNCTIKLNQSPEGGGLLAQSGLVQDCLIEQNTTAFPAVDDLFPLVVENQQFLVHKYTRAGEHTFVPPSGVSEVEYLIVGGGGSGGMCTSMSGGGGGAGGVLTGAVAVADISYPIIVGAGGEAVSATFSQGNNGENSGFGALIAFGGGGGGGAENTGGPGLDGGSGGGGVRYNDTQYYAGGQGVSGQGHDGGQGKAHHTTLGRGAGGGGGAGGPGASVDGSNAQCGHGGAGLYSAITGESVAYAGGGGGGFNYNPPGVGLGGIGGGGSGGWGIADSGQSGQPNSGGGGGGGRWSDNKSLTSGAGGSGVVVLRYRIPASVSIAELMERYSREVAWGGRGAGVSMRGNAVLRDSRVIANHGADTGGGVYAREEALLDNCNVVSNRAFVAGGGVYLNSESTDLIAITKCEVDSNAALGRMGSNADEGSGGGIALLAGSCVESVVKKNVAAHGGGIHGAGGRVINCTLSDNRGKGRMGDSLDVIEVEGRRFAIHRYLQVGENAFTPPEGVEEVEYLVVAGGGGGG